MKIAFIILYLACGILARTQQQRYDIFTFSPPKGWEKNTRENVIDFSITDNAQRTWSRVSIVKSTASKGEIRDDFESEWRDLVLKPYKQYGVMERPVSIDSQVHEGWKVYSGLGRFVFNKDTAAVILNTFSDGQRCASFTIMSNTTAYGNVLDSFVASVELAKVNNTGSQRDDKDELPEVVETSSKLIQAGYQFNITNFDDGWTSTAMDDWVEAKKGNTRVLLHYPRKEDDVYYPQYEERMAVFWNLLVSPRYTSLRNYESPRNNTYEPAYFACGLARENASGKDVWVTLFSKGKSGWIEIITPDKASFVKSFGIENPGTYFSEWDPLVRLAGMNRFAVGENDLTGKWSNQFTGSTAYYNIYTGLYTGSTTFASRVNFAFNANKTYNWDLVMGNGGTGTLMKVDHAKASGTWKQVNNWQLWLSDIERKPKTYNAYFSCVKGGRILWLQDVEYGSYTAYGKISQ